MIGHGQDPDESGRVARGTTTRRREIAKILANKRESPTLYRPATVL
jgi:hypothetical protein